MNLKTCVECGEKYSPDLKKCPNCAYKIEECKLKNNPDKSFNKKWKSRFVVLVAIIITLVIISVFIVNMLITSQEIKQLEKEADSLYEQGNYETAIVIYSEILSIKDVPEINARIIECEIAINTIYFGNLTLASDAIKASGKICRKICALTNTVWIYSPFYEDEYNQDNYDANSALSDLYQTQEIQDSFSALFSTKYEIDLQMKNLQSTPDNYVDLFSEIIILYEKYSNLYNHVTTYNGTSLSYKNKSEYYINDYEDQYEKVDSLIAIDPIDNVSQYFDLTGTNIYTETANLIDIDKELQRLFASYYN